MNLLTEEVKQSLQAKKIDIIEDEELQKDGLFHVKVEFTYVHDLNNETEEVEFVLKPNRLSDDSDDHIELIMQHDSLEIAYEVLMMPEVYHEVVRQIQATGYKEPTKTVADIKPEAVEESVKKSQTKLLIENAMVKYKGALERLKDA